MVVKRQLNNTSCQHQYGRKYGHTLHIFSAHILTSWRYSETKDFTRNSCGWVKFKVNLQIWSRTNIFTVKRTHLFVNCINILPLQLFALTSPCSCKRNPTIARNATYLSFHLYILHHTCLYIVGASLVRFSDPHYIVSRGTWIGQAMQCRHHHHIDAPDCSCWQRVKSSERWYADTVGLCLVMQTMTLTVVYLNWWVGSVQWLSVSFKTLFCISFPEKYISHKSDEQYFLERYLCISSQLVPFALVGYLATRWRHLY